MFPQKGCILKKGEGDDLKRGLASYSSMDYSHYDDLRLLNYCVNVKMSISLVHEKSYYGLRI